MVDKTALEGTAKNLLLMVNEYPDTFVFQAPDDTSPEVDHLFIVVGKPLIDDALSDMLLACLIEEVEQQRRNLLVGKQFQFVSILQVHDFIADVIGSLNEIYQRMAHVFQRLSRL